MTELKGTEKQIKWAEEIRNNNIKKLETEIEELTVRMLKDSPSFAPLIAKLEKALDQIKNDTTKDAKWWIEHQNLASAFISRVKAQ